MARVDDEHVEITVAIVGMGRAPVDFLAPRAAKLSVDRETLEAAPVFRFGMRGELSGRSFVVVMSALPLEVLFQADIVVAIHTSEPGLEEALDRYDLLPIDPRAVPQERLMTMGAARRGPEQGAHRAGRFPISATDEAAPVGGVGNASTCGRHEGGNAAALPRPELIRQRAVDDRPESARAKALSEITPAAIVYEEQ